MLEHYLNCSWCFACSTIRCATILESGSEQCRVSSDVDSCLSTDLLNGNPVRSAVKDNVVVSSSWLAQLLFCLTSAGSSATKHLFWHPHLKRFASLCWKQFQPQYPAERNEFLSQEATGCAASQWFWHEVLVKRHYSILCSSLNNVDLIM
jgi:hypothetical protein